MTFRVGRVPLLGAFFALGAACTRDELQNRPRTSASTEAPSTPTGSGAPASASAVPSAPSEHLLWEVPPGWRDLGVPLQGVMKGHYQALVENPGARVPEDVDVFVVRHEGARGDTPEARLADVVARETEAFTRVDWKKAETRVVDGRTVPTVEIHGAMHEMVPAPPDWEQHAVERAHRVEITAFVPTKTFPYRVAVHGREDLVERVRDDFLRFVDSIRVKDEEGTRSATETAITR